MQLDSGDRKGQSRYQKKAPDTDNDGEQQEGIPPTVGFMGHTFVDLDTKQEQKVVKRAVNATLPDVPSGSTGPSRRSLGAAKTTRPESSTRANSLWSLHHRSRATS